MSDADRQRLRSLGFFDGGIAAPLEAAGLQDLFDQLSETSQTSGLSPRRAYEAALQRFSAAAATGDADATQRARRSPLTGHVQVCEDADMETQTTSITLPRDLWLLAKAETLARRTTLSDLCTAALRDYLKMPGKETTK